LEVVGRISFIRYPQAPSISHLLFADDCSLICHACLDECSTFSDVLQADYSASGQSVNLSKSSMHVSSFSINIVGWLRV